MTESILLMIVQLFPKTSFVVVVVGPVAALGILGMMNWERLQFIEMWETSRSCGRMANAICG